MVAGKMVAGKMVGRKPEVLGRRMSRNRHVAEVGVLTDSSSLEVEPGTHPEVGIHLGLDSRR